MVPRCTHYETHFYGVSKVPQTRIEQVFPQGCSRGSITYRPCLETILDLHALWLKYRTGLRISRKRNWARLVNHTERCGSKITRGRLLELQRRIESDLSQLSVMKTSAKAPFDKEKYLRSVDFRNRATQSSKRPLPSIDQQTNLLVFSVWIQGRQRPPTSGLTDRRPRFFSAW